MSEKNPDFLWCKNCFHWTINDAYEWRNESGALAACMNPKSINHQLPTRQHNTCEHHSDKEQN